MNCNENQLVIEHNDNFYCVCLGRTLSDECELTYCVGFDNCPYRAQFDSVFREEYLQDPKNVALFNSLKEHVCR